MVAFAAGVQRRRLVSLPFRPDQPAPPGPGPGRVDRPGLLQRRGAPQRRAALQQWPHERPLHTAVLQLARGGVDIQPAARARQQPRRQGRGLPDRPRQRPTARGRAGRRAGRHPGRGARGRRRPDFLDPDPVPDHGRGAGRHGRVRAGPGLGAQAQLPAVLRPADHGLVGAHRALLARRAAGAQRRHGGLHRHHDGAAQRLRRQVPARLCRGGRAPRPRMSRHQSACTRAPSRRCSRPGST